MKNVKAFLIICFLTLSQIGFTQQYGYFDVRSGFGDFVLRAPKKSFDSAALRLAGDIVTWKGRTEYAWQFMPAKTKPYDLANIPFSEIILTFDQTDTLFRMVLLKAYVQKLDTNFADAARADFQNLYKLLKASWDKKGKKEITTQNVGNTITSYDWEVGKLWMILSLNEDKRQRISSIELSLENKN